MCNRGGTTMKDFLKKHWRICIIMVLIPFALEKFLILTPVVSQFSNEVWFSFIASYVGAVVTVIVMFVTFDKSDQENKKIINKQIKIHEIELENQRLERTVNVLLLDGYTFWNENTLCENLNKYVKDFRDIQYNIYKSPNVHEKDRELFFDIMILQRKEADFIKKLEEQMCDSNNISIKDIQQILYELQCMANNERNKIKNEYEKYIEKTYKEYYT